MNNYTVPLEIISTWDYSKISSAAILFPANSQQWIKKTETTALPKTNAVASRTQLNTSVTRQARLITTLTLQRNLVCMHNSFEKLHNLIKNRELKLSTICGLKILVKFTSLSWTQVSSYAFRLERQFFQTTAVDFMSLETCSLSG